MVTVFLGVSALVLGWVVVPLRVGRLTMLAIPLLVGSLLLTPLECALIAIVGNIGRYVQGKDNRWQLFMLGPLWSSVAAALRIGLNEFSAPALLVPVITTVFALSFNIVSTLVHVWGFRNEPIRASVRTVLDRTFGLAFLYFGLAGLLATSLIDGSLPGFIRTACLFILSLVLLRAVSEHIAGESLRQQLMVFDERIAFGQEAEAALHAVKNQLLLSSMYIEEISADRLTPEDRDALHIVFESLQQSTDVLRRTSASGRAANAPVYADAELVELTRAVVVLGEARAAQRGVRIRLAAKDKRVPVFADGLLIREVLTNLVQNSLEVLDAGGHIDVTVGIRPDGSPFVEVADDGPGLAPEQVATLFASRTSTKHGSGAGIGLTLSHAIATQHGGRLTYVSGKRRGATFRLVLPARDVARALLAGGRHPQLVVTPAAPGS